MKKLTKRQIKEQEEKKQKIQMRDARIFHTFKAYTLYHSLKEDEIFISEDDERRQSIVSQVYGYYCEVYNKLIHTCNNMPESAEIWCNTFSSHRKKEYWVKHSKGEIGGIHVITCPFCGAELEKGKGDVIVFKTHISEKKWKQKFKCSFNN